MQGRKAILAWVISVKAADDSKRQAGTAFGVHRAAVLAPATPGSTSSFREYIIRKRPGRKLSPLRGLGKPEPKVERKLGKQ